MRTQSAASHYTEVTLSFNCVLIVYELFAFLALSLKLLIDLSQVGNDLWSVGCEVESQIVFNLVFFLFSDGLISLLMI